MILSSGAVFTPCCSPPSGVKWRCVKKRKKNLRHQLSAESSYSHNYRSQLWLLVMSKVNSSINDPKKNKYIPLSARDTKFSWSQTDFHSTWPVYPTYYLLSGCLESCRCRPAGVSLTHTHRRIKTDIFWAAFCVTGLWLTQRWDSWVNTARFSDTLGRRSGILEDGPYVHLKASLALTMSRK